MSIQVVLFPVFVEVTVIFALLGLLAGARRTAIREPGLPVSTAPMWLLVFFGIAVT